VRRVAEDRALATVTSAALARAAISRQQFEDTVREGIPVYGVTTGYGEMIYMLVDTSKEVELQTNLVRSHSAGVGPLFAEDEARAILAARLNALSKGYSAVRAGTAGAPGAVPEPGYHAGHPGDRFPWRQR